MEIIMTAITDGVPVGFSFGKRYGIDNEVFSNFKEDANSHSFILHLIREPQKQFLYLHVG